VDPRALVLLWLFASSFVAAADDPKPAFDAAASKLKFLAADDLLYDRFPDRVNPPEDRDEHNRIVAALFDRHDSADALLSLLKDPNPKVRTLAVAALDHLGEAKVLPQLFALCDDRAPTLPHPGLVAMIPGMERDVTPLEPQTVSDFPKAIVRRYLTAAGPSGDVEQFPAYWEARKGRAYCASWFKVRLERATQGVRPVPAGRAAQVDALRDEIDRLAQPDRAWTILYLDAGADHVLFGDAACLAAAKSLGPDALLTTLNGKCPSDDPDLHAADADNDPTTAMQLWALRHARELFRPGDAEAILKLQRLHTPWYAIAAANLDPNRAGSIIGSAFRVFSRHGYADAWARSDLAIARWQLKGLAVAGETVNWFYAETLKDEGVPHSRVKFLQALDPKSLESRAMTAALVNDPRFATLDWSSLKAMLTLINGWTKSPVVDPQEIQNLRHPYGEQHAVQQPEQAAQVYPEQTKGLNAALDRWRASIKASVGEWSKQ